MYFAAHQSYLIEPSSDHPNAKEALHSEVSLNARASYLSSQDIYGDAILASIGFTWRSKDLFYEDVSVQSYYRSLLTSCILLDFFYHIDPFQVISKMIILYLNEGLLDYTGCVTH